MSPIPLPEVFQHTHAWTYGCPYASPSLGSESIVPPELSDPDIVFVRPPDKVHVFKTPGAMQYIPVPEMPPDTSDPTGMQRMMKFLGFDDKHVDVAVSNVSSQMNPPPGNPSSSISPGSGGQPGQTLSSNPSTNSSQPSIGAGSQNLTIGSNQLQPGLIRSL